MYEFFRRPRLSKHGLLFQKVALNFTVLVAQTIEAGSSTIAHQRHGNQKDSTILEMKSISDSIALVYLVSIPLAWGCKVREGLHFRDNWLQG